MSDRKTKRAPKAEAAKPRARAAAPRRAKAAAMAAPAAKATKTAPAAAKAPAAAAKAPAAAAKAAATIEHNVAKGTQVMTNETIKRAEAVQNEAADRFQAVVGDANKRAKTAMEKGAKLVEELTDLTKGNVEAMVASSKVAAKGVETLSREAADYGRRSFEQASATLKSFAEVRSPTDFFKLQSDYARSAFDGAVAESAKISEAMLKLAGQVAEPITGRYSVAAERVKNVAL